MGIDDREHRVVRPHHHRLAVIASGLDLPNDLCLRRITPDALKAMLNEAIAANVKITGSVEITGANAEAAQ